jgi:hypothetical protein
MINIYIHAHIFSCCIVGIPSSIGMKCKTSTTSTEVHKALLQFLTVEINRALIDHDAYRKKISIIPILEKISYQGTNILLGNSSISSIVSEGENFQAIGTLGQSEPQTVSGLTIINAIPAHITNLYRVDLTVSLKVTFSDEVQDVTFWITHAHPIIGIHVCIIEVVLRMHTCIYILTHLDVKGILYA